MGLHEPGKVSSARRRVAALESGDGLVRVQEVLCEPARLKIVGALEIEELSVGDLAAAIGRRLPATSQHLRVLRELGLVEGQRRGTTVYYRLRPGPAVEQIRAVLELVQQQHRAAS